ncbi:MAG TPA: hypothetical protein VF310_15950 [Vicinamibacteria bacterium]
MPIVGAMHRSRWPAVLAALTLALADGGCSYPPQIKRTLVPPDQPGTLDRKAPYLKAHLRDGGVYLLARWTVDEAGGTVAGEGELMGPDRQVREKGPFTVPLTSVVLFETNVVPPSPSLADRTVMTGISLAVTAACLTWPKACFGSCPTFYVGEGAEARLMAEGFSTSIAPSLEATDVDALPGARPRGRRFEVHMTNEALETHVVRQVHLLAARRPPGGRVVADRTGALFAVTGLRAPASCAAEEGDCRQALAAQDGRERTSASDGRDLAARELLDLTFDGPGDGPLGLVVGARQTLLTTFLLYQTLAYMGPAAGDWLALLERQGPASPVVERVHALRDVLGGIEVLVPDGDGGWTRVGEVYETGPLASDVKVLPLPAMEGPPRVRLRVARGHFRVDSVALARLGAAVTPQRLAPVEVRREDGPRVDAFARGPLVTFPGDRYRFVYQLPPEPDSLELFLESRGYYLEWMRQEWLAEADPAAVMRVFGDPRRTLVDLAPEYHRQEAEMEKAFWSSRYAAR